MTKSTSRVEAILESVRAAIKDVRAEYNDGQAVEDVHTELKHVEERFSARLKDLQEWNAKQKATEAKAVEAPVEQKAAKLEPAVKPVQARR